MRVERMCVRTSKAGQPRRLQSCGVSNFLRGGVHLSVLRDVTVELAKNGAMGLPVVRARRLRRARTSDMATGRDAWLERYALMAHDRAAQRVRFIDQYRSYVINYNLGKDMVREFVETRAGGSPERRWNEFAGLISSPRLPSGLR